jgi:hypothetical protein
MWTVCLSSSSNTATPRPFSPPPYSEEIIKQPVSISKLLFLPPQRTSGTESQLKRKEREKGKKKEASGSFPFPSLRPLNETCSIFLVFILAVGPFFFRFLVCIFSLLVECCQLTARIHLLFFFSAIGGGACP